MAAAIKVVQETELEPDGAGGWEAKGAKPDLGVAVPPAPAAAPPVRDPEVVGAIGILNARLQAVESAVVGIPQSVGIVQSLSRALGTRLMMLLAALGCIGLAAATALSPSWPGVGIFAAFAVLVYLPLAYLASKGN